MKKSVLMNSFIYSK